MDYKGLRSVYGHVTIQSNNELDSLFGLDSLNMIQGSLNVQNNVSLMNLNALNALDVVDESLYISHNDALNNCDGICEILSHGSIGGSTSIHSNPSPCSSETEITISCVDGLCPSGDVVLQTQNEVDAFVNAFSLCDTIPGSLTIEGGNSITDLRGLSFITHFLSDLTIRNNYQFNSLEGFENLKEIHGDLRIENNHSLNDLSQLNALEKVGSDLRLYNNDALLALTGLENLDSVGSDLTVQFNASLSDCSVICDLLDGTKIGGNVSINNNPAPCNAVDDLQTFCIYGSSLTIDIQNLADTVIEGDSVLFDLILSEISSDSIILSLSSSDILEAPVPSMVSIPPGQTSIPVSFHVTDDDLGRNQRIDHHHRRWPFSSKR